jgi:hypothetical protein
VLPVQVMMKFLKAMDIVRFLEIQMHALRYAFAQGVLAVTREAEQQQQQEGEGGLDADMTEKVSQRLQVYL